MGYGTICSMHRERIRLTGSPGGVEARHELPPKSYRSAHNRVRISRGAATLYQCVDCGGAAVEWSYRGGDPDEREEPWKLPHGEPTMVAFSNDVTYYDPRCKPCHVSFDKRRA
ncbi:hypothetical protein BIZ70_gp032 [Gordonia phage JSwag]|nr:hypothetical protein BIZ70_gp032 [Gordonia phage JSwag]AOE44491.1 hypothetical protein SEA_JSWAG_81 [Gordonia phage JSwag]QFP95145.1 hypothetical protein SEA_MINECRAFTSTEVE_81 [Gordonia phage MinecraftSteve]